MTIQYRTIAFTNFAWVVQDNHLCEQASCFHWWVIFAAPRNVTTSNILVIHSPFVEGHVVQVLFTQNFMVHFSRFYLSCDSGRDKGTHHDWFENTSLLHLAHRDSAGTINFIDILEGQLQRFISWING